MLRRTSALLRPRDLQVRALAAASTKFVSPPMVYISGEEMTKYCMDLILDHWIKPYVDTSKWEFFDLSCVSRDSTEDQCLRDAVAAGSRVGAIFKEPTVTPSIPILCLKLGLADDRLICGSSSGPMSGQPRCRSSCSA